MWPQNSAEPRVIIVTIEWAVKIRFQFIFFKTCPNVVSIELNYRASGGTWRGEKLMRGALLELRDLAFTFYYFKAVCFQVSNRKQNRHKAGGFPFPVGLCSVIWPCGPSTVTCGEVRAWRGTDVIAIRSPSLTLTLQTIRSDDWQQLTGCV